MRYLMKLMQSMKRDWLKCYEVFRKNPVSGHPCVSRVELFSLYLISNPLPSELFTSVFSPLCVLCG